MKQSPARRDVELAGRLCQIASELFGDAKLEDRVMAVLARPGSRASGNVLSRILRCRTRDAQLACLRLAEQGRLRRVGDKWARAEETR